MAYEYLYEKTNMVKIDIIHQRIMTYCITVLVEDQRRGLPVVLESTVNGIVALANSWHDDDEEDKRIGDGRMCSVSVL